MPSIVINNATSRLASTHMAGSGTLVLRAGEGARFGTPSADDPIRVTVAARSTLVNGQVAPTSTFTIFLCTGRTADTLTGLTAAEGTTDQNFFKNDPVAALITAGTLEAVAASAGPGEVTGLLKGEGGAFAAATPSVDYATPDDLAAKADDTAVVKLAGDQTIAGVKTFANAATAAQASLSTLSLVCIGDSTTWGFLLPDQPHQSWPALIGQILSASVDNRGMSGQASTAIKADLVANVANPASKSFILLWGRNDFGAGVPVATLKANTQAAVTYFGSNKYVLLTIHYRTAEVIGTQMHTDIAAYNQWLIDTFPGHVLDINPILAAAGNPNNAQDVANVANGVPPQSLLTDDVHQNAAGCAVFAEAILASWLPTLLPAATPVLEGRSLSRLLGRIANRASTTQGNAFVGTQVFRGDTTHYGGSQYDGDGRGVTVDSQNARRTGYWKVQGKAGGLYRSSGITLPFVKSSNTSDITDAAATLTDELRWSDGLFTFLSQIFVGSAGNGIIVDNTAASSKRYGILNQTGIVARHTRASTWTLNFGKTSSTTDVTTGTYTDELVWSDTGWAFSSPLFVAGNGVGIAFDNNASAPSIKRLAILSKAGAFPQVIRAATSVINFAKSSSTSDATNTTTLTTEVAWSDAGWAFSVPLAAGGGLTVGGGAAVSKVLPASATLDFPSIAAGGQQELTIAVTGAAANAAVSLGPPAALEAGLTAFGYVSATDTVKVRLTNTTAAPVDPASATYRVVVFNP